MVTKYTTCLFLWQMLVLSVGHFYTNIQVQRWWTILHAHKRADMIITVRSHQVRCKRMKTECYSGDWFSPFSSNCNLVDYTSYDSRIKWYSFHNGHYETSCGTNDLFLHCVWIRQSRMIGSQWSTRLQFYCFSFESHNFKTGTPWSPGYSCHICLSITLHRWFLILS